MNIRIVHLVGKYQLLKSRNAIILIFASPTVLLLKVWSMGQQQQQHLGSLLEMDDLGSHRGFTESKLEF